MLPTLLPTQPNVTSGTNQKEPICRKKSAWVRQDLNLRRGDYESGRALLWASASSVVSRLLTAIAGVIAGKGDGVVSSPFMLPILLPNSLVFVGVGNPATPPRRKRSIKRRS